MTKRLLALAVLALLPFVAAPIIVQAPGGGGSACITQSTYQASNTTTGGYYSNDYTSGFMLGQGAITFDASYDVYSISARLTDFSCTPASGTLFVRFGAETAGDCDLTSVYTEKTWSGTFDDSGGHGEIEIVFDAGSRPSVTNSGTYCFFFGVDGASANDCSFDFDSTAPLAGSNQIYADSGGGDSTFNQNGDDTGYDFRHTLKVCD